MSCCNALGPCRALPLIAVMTSPFLSPALLAGPFAITFTISAPVTGEVSGW